MFQLNSTRIVLAYTLADEASADDILGACAAAIAIIDAGASNFHIGLNHSHSPIFVSVVPTFPVSYCNKPCLISRLYSLLQRSQIPVSPLLSAAGCRYHSSCPRFKWCCAVNLSMHLLLVSTQSFVSNTPCQNVGLFQTLFPHLILWPTTESKSTCYYS